MRSAILNDTFHIELSTSQELLDDAMRLTEVIENAFNSDAGFSLRFHIGYSLRALSVWWLDNGRKGHCGYVVSAFDDFPRGHFHTSFG